MSEQHDGSCRLGLGSEASERLAATSFATCKGLWSEVLKLAAVVEDALNQSIHALCDGRIELADQIKLQKPAVDRWEVQSNGSACACWR